MPNPAKWPRKAHCPLPDQKLADPMKPHHRPCHRLTDLHGIHRVILLPPHSTEDAGISGTSCPNVTRTRAQWCPVARSDLGGPFRTTAWNHRRKVAELMEVVDRTHR
jgi:hypothetical protein